MKKIIAMLLIVLFIFGLVACGSSSDTPAPADDKGDSAQPADGGESSSDTSTPADEPEDSTVPAEEDGQDAEPAAGTAGYYYDEVDHHARDEYHFVYQFTASSALTDSMMNAWALMKDKYNFTVTESTGEGDQEAYVQGLEVVLDKGVDGIFLDCDPTISSRVLEILSEYDTPYVCMFNDIRNDDGAVVAPCLGLMQYQSGFDAVQYYVDSYKEYWGDVELTDNIGLLNLDWSTSPPLHDRCVGATDAFLAKWPQGKVVEGDGVTIGHINSETGYELASQFISANPDVEYWIIIGCVEDYSQGAARFVETMPSQDKVLITTVGSVILPIEWDSGYDGAWKSCYAIADMSYAGPAACGLIALADGRATFETLWPERRAEGDLATLWIADSIIMTHDNYAGYMQSVNDTYCK